MMKHFHGLIAASCLGIAAAFSATDAGSSPVIREVAIECRASSSNDGCEKMVGCPSGTSIRTARAACNLEHGSVTDEQLASVEPGYIKVVRRSDRADDASCWVGTSRLGSGQVAIADIAGLNGVSVGCQEHDKNGGDCHIRGALHCE